MPDPVLSLDAASLSDLLRALQARLDAPLGALPAGVTLTLSVGAPPPVVAVQPLPSPDADMRLWYSPKELAALHGVRPATIQKWVREGRFPGAHRLPNGAIRIPKDTAEAVLAAVESPAPFGTHTTAAGTKRTAAAGSSGALRGSPAEAPRFDGWRRSQRVGS